LALDPELNLLLVVTGFLQLGALATRITGRKRAALVMAAVNAAIALALTLFISVGALTSRERIHVVNALFVTVEVGVAGAAAIGLAKRKESGWLFWTVWLWNFVMVYALVRVRFFLQLTF
jgi:hypothetical protein